MPWISLARTKSVSFRRYSSFRGPPAAVVNSADVETVSSFGSLRLALTVDDGRLPSHQRKSKEECTEAVEELRAVRAECNFARKNAVRCQRALAREKSRRKDARVCWPSTESSPTGNDVLQRGRQGPGALSLPSGDDEGCISLDEDEDEDSLDDERGGRTGEACSSSASGKRKRKLERQDGPSGSL